MRFSWRNWHYKNPFFIPHIQPWESWAVQILYGNMSVGAAACRQFSGEIMLTVQDSFLSAESTFNRIWDQASIHHPVCSSATVDAFCWATCADPFLPHRQRPNARCFFFFSQMCMLNPIFDIKMIFKQKDNGTLIWHEWIILLSLLLLIPISLNEPDWCHYLV